jgi:hypothetical protein
MLNNIIQIYRSKTLFIMTIMVTILIGSTMSSRSEVPAADSSFTASVTYYSDARGKFTLTPPPATTGYLLQLKGTSSLPALAVHIKKKKAGSQGRQIAYNMQGKKVYDFNYIIKDGTGEYDVTIYGKKSINAMNLNGLCAFTVHSDSDLPKNYSGLDISGRVLAHVNSVMGKTVGSGECWDLAQEALDAAGADWIRPFKFGLPLDPIRDEIRAGDIIQFRSVRMVKMLKNGGKMFHTLGAPDHTAIIIGVEGKKKYRLAHQNSNGKRYVITSEVDLNDMVSGTFLIYRPVAGIVH